MTVGPGDLLTAARVCRETLASATDEDWSVLAGELGWSCRTTLAHVADGLTLYAVHLATAATVRRPGPRCRDEELTQAELLEHIECRAAVLAAVAEATPPDGRAFHPAGAADAAGWCAMGCDEILVHCSDVAAGLGLDCRPPEELCTRLRDRLFPWAPSDVDPWRALLWANGRTALPGHDRLGADWFWQCAPLREWDGVRKRRVTP